MNVKFKKSDGVLTLYIYGELDEYTAISVKNTVDNVIMSNLNVGKVIFDLSGVTFMDSTGIGLLIGRYKKIKQFNISSYISGASVASERVLELAGIYQIMPRV